MAIQRDAFIIMPFSPTPSCQDWTEIYDHVFKPTLTDLGWSCERATPTTGSLIASIIQRLSTASVVLADLTDRNANVFYELGVRHSVSLRTIMLSQHIDHVPSDLKGYWHIGYGITPGRVAQFKDDLRRVLSEIENAPERNDNPVADYLAKNDQTLSRLINRETLKKLNALSTELSGNIQELNAFYRSDQWKSGATPDQFVFGTSCLSLLLDTYYVDLGPDILAMAYQLKRDFDRLQRVRFHGLRVDEFIATAQLLLEKVNGARDEIQKGTFVEPSTTSFMEWFPSQQEGSRSWTCAACRVAIPQGQTVCIRCGAAGRLGEIDCISRLLRPKTVDKSDTDNLVLASRALRRRSPKNIEKKPPK